MEMEAPAIMSWQRWALAAVVIVFAAAQYGLLVYSLIDLRRRPRAHGENKMGWVLVIAAIPIAGPLLYGTFGPTNFLLLPRPHRPPRHVNLVLNEDDLRDAP